MMIPFFLLLCTGIGPAALEKDTSIRDLEAGKTTAGELEVLAGYSNYATFRFQVPDTIFAVRVSLSGAPADLDLYLKYGEEIRDYGYVDMVEVSETFNESVFLTRMNDPPLRTGTYYLDVTYRKGAYPVVAERALTSIPFFLTLEYIHAQEQAYLAAGIPQRVTLDPMTGMFAMVAIDVPDSAQVLRLDVFDTSGDVDLMIGVGRPALSRGDAVYIAESYLGKESLVIRRGTHTDAGRYYISITDQLTDQEPVQASILATFSERVPERLTTYPQLPRLVRNIDLALVATWEIIGDAATGSGCVVNPEGLILTTWHVVRDRRGEISPALYGALSLNHESPPEELFRLEVLAVDRERDLALLKVVSGLYGQPLPTGYRFPCFQLGDSETLRIGDPLTFVGFPGVGGMGSRPSVSLTRGVVSGFSAGGFCRYIKTDGTIGSGNSGGAALNRQWELIGLPVVTMGPEESRMAFIIPVSAVPAEWAARISAGTKTSPSSSWD